MASSTPSAPPTEPTRRSLNEYFKGEGGQVTIYVGPEREKWVLHEDLLCDRAPYFKAAFKSDFREGNEKTMDLPEDNPKAFAIFVDWVYTGLLNCDDCVGPTTSFFKHPTAPYDLDLFALWIFADKIALKELAEEVYGRIDDCSGEVINISEEGLRFVYENTAESSSLRGLIVSVIVDRYFHKGTEGSDYYIKGKDLGQLAASHATFTGDLLQRIQEHIALYNEDCRIYRCISHRREGKNPKKVMA